MRKKNLDVNSVKFSVLMSVYYKETPEFLDLSLKSVLIDQTVVPSEVVLVKDGPLTNDLEMVLSNYLSLFPKIIKIVALEENVGLGKALQIGLEHCKYDLVMRMDTDDIAVKNRFELQLTYMIKHPDVSVVGGKIGEFLESPDEELRIKDMPIEYQDVVKYSKFRNPLNHMTVCFRKKDVLEVGNYQPMLYLEDHYLWARLLVAGKKIANLSDLLVKVRIGNGFYERRGTNKYLIGWKELQQYLYENKYINYFQKMRNKTGMIVIVYCPEWFRKVLYDKVLRSRSKVK